MTTENDDLARVTREDAIKFLEGACRNWKHVPRLSDEDVRDVATELTRFVGDRLSSQGEPVAWLTEWKSDGEDWVNAHANEVTAIDEARAHRGTVTPLYAAPQPSVVAEGRKQIDVGSYNQGADDALVRAVRELTTRRVLLNSQFEAVDILREDGIYAICIEAIEALTNSGAAK